jgi:hypothetical protein
MLPPHLKRKKCKKKFYILPHETTTQKREKRVSRCSKERKEKEEKGGEGRRKKAETHSAEPTGLDLAGHRDRRWRLAGAFL